jgi:sulfatase maturation enzyme AslB (radical SAM superfamily)
MAEIEKTYHQKTGRYKTPADFGIEVNPADQFNPDWCRGENGCSVCKFKPYCNDIAEQNRIFEKQTKQQQNEFDNKKVE